MAEQGDETLSLNGVDLDLEQIIPIQDFMLDLETQTSNLMIALESWRELTLAIRSILLWEKNYYPSAIIGGSVIVFVTLWVLEPSILTTLSLIGLTLTISDYLVPVLSASLFRADSWTPNKEKAYYDFCNALVIYKEKICISWASFYIMRSTKPKTFYGCTILTLVALAWLGNTFNNLFLTFLFVTILLLVPGMERHGVLYKWGKFASQKFVDCTKLKSSQSVKED